MEKQTFDVSGMTCAACQAAVDRAVHKLDGVEGVDVSLLSESMNVEYDPSKVSAAQIEEAVKAAGYSAALQSAPAQGQAADSPASIWEKRSQRIKEESEHKKKTLISSLVLLCILLCFSMLPMIGIFSFLMDHEWMMVDAIIQMFLSTVILFIQRDFFVHGFKTLFHGSPNMDTLVAVGSSVSFLYGFYGLLTMAYGYAVMDHEMVHESMNALYFESAAMIVTLVSLGKYLEARSKSKTGDALAHLVSLAPKTALVERNGQFVEIPAEQVRAGDLVKIVPGASIPVDGVVVEGDGTLDQSAITGESMPVDKVPGDEVMSASTNLNGSFVMRATKVGSDTTLAQIITLVDEAGNSKAPIARLADKVSGVFVPVVLSLAALTFVGWLIAGQSIGFALNCAISVLVISCPCALGLATPLAIMVSTGKAAQYGILVKSASAMETLAKVNTVVLDKTGTITKGRPAVVSMVLFDPNLKEDNFLRLAAAAESGSEHPLAKAVMNYAQEKELSLPKADSFRAFGGKGLEAAVEGTQILAGNRAFMEEQNIPLGQKAQAAAAKIADEGGTPLFFALNGKLEGIIGAADEVRPTSRQAISLLRKDGIDVIMLTGDNARTAQAIAKDLHVSQVISDVLPADKESVIRSLQSEGKIVAMVGDGINDAPALTRADVGFAIKSGTDIAIESADIVLMKNSLLDVVTAIELSRATIRNIKQNLFWAFFYNLLGIPVAMGLFYPINGWLLNPMIGAAAMSFSSVTVCLNALSLRLFKPAKAVLEDEKADEESGPSQVQVIYEDEQEASAPAAEKKPLTKQKLALKMAGTPTRVQPAAKKPADNKANDQAPAASTALFWVDGMSCAHCQKRVHEALLAALPDSSNEVSLDPAWALVESKKPLNIDELFKAVENAGYSCRSSKESRSFALSMSKPAVQADVNGMLEQLLQTIPSISSAVCMSEEGILQIGGNNLPDDQKLLSVIADIGSNQKGNSDLSHTNVQKGGETMILKIEGMSCGHCKARVEKALDEVAGVESVSVDLANGSATVAGNAKPADLAKAVTNAGYTVTDIED